MYQITVPENEPIPFHRGQCFRIQGHLLIDGKKGQPQVPGRAQFHPVLPRAEDAGAGMGRGAGLEDFQGRGRMVPAYRHRHGTDSLPDEIFQEGAVVPQRAIGYPGPVAVQAGRQQEPAAKTVHGRMGGRKRGEGGKRAPG